LTSKEGNDFHFEELEFDAVLAEGLISVRVYKWPTKRGWYIVFSLNIWMKE
jgi:hypothetical protein